MPKFMTIGTTLITESTAKIILLNAMGRATRSQMTPINRSEFLTTHSVTVSDFFAESVLVRIRDNGDNIALNGATKLH